jgi:outer membrane biosynthesis protein TonB
MHADLPADTVAPDEARQLWLKRAGAVLCSILVHLCLFSLFDWPRSAAPEATRLRVSLRSPQSEVQLPSRPPDAAAGVRRPPPPPPAAPVPAEPAQPSAMPDEPSAKPGEADQDGLPYLPADQLDVRPEFPPDLEERVSAGLAETESGRVVLQLLIGEDGRVNDVELEESELSEQASLKLMENFSSLQLVPGQRGGKPVRTRWHLEFTFSVAP